MTERGTVLRSTHLVQEVHKVLHLGQNNPMHQYQPANGEQQSAVNGLGAMVNTKVNMSKWLLLLWVRQLHPGLCEEECGVGAVTAPLRSGLGRLHLEHCVQLWFPESKINVGKPKRSSGG